MRVLHAFAFVMCLQPGRSLALPVPSPGYDAVEVVKVAESIRTLENAEARVDLTTVDGKQSISYDLLVMRPTGPRALIDFRGPAAERGRKLLAVDRNYWATFPESRRVVVISRREMIGSSVFSMVDLFEMDVVNDYEPKVVGMEKAAGLSLLQVTLSAKHRDAPYSRIDYWVETPGFFPVRADFYGQSGKVLKKMFIESRAVLGGKERPERFRMEDAVVLGKVSTWNTRTVMPKKYPESLFTREALQR